MKQAEFEHNITKNKEFNSVLLYGQSGYLVSKYAKQLVSKYQGADIQRAYFDEYSFIGAKSFLSQNSLFGDKLIYWLMSDKKIDKKEADELARLAHKNDALFLVQFLGDLSTKDSTFTNLFSEKVNGCEVRFFASFRAEDSIRLLKEEAMLQNIDIDKDALYELLGMQNGDLELAVCELGKFCSLGRKVCISDVRDLAGANELTEMEKLTDEIFELKPFINTVEHLLEKSGFDEMRITLNLQYALYDLYKIFICAKAGLSTSAKDIKGANIPDFIWRNYIMRATKIKEVSYQKLLDTIINCEYELKTQKGNEARLILYSHLLKFQAVLITPPPNNLKL